MGFMRHIKACNQHDPAKFIPLKIQGMEIGKVRPLFAENLARWPQLFHVTDSSVEFVFPSPDLRERSAALADVIQQLVNEKILCALHGEMYAANDGHLEKPLLLIDRAIAPYFGIRSYGQHLNGFVRTNDGMKLWIARRAKDRANYPGCLDNFVAGGLPHGLNLAENMAKECWEEAAVPAEIASRAIPVGAVSYNVDTVKGFNPFTLFCYDLELPQDFQPRCTDGEVECFYLWPVEKVMEIVKERDEFKLNCNLVIIDFLIRHGFIGPEDDDYLEFISGLHLSWNSCL
jgi:8-oxo-dGTP pyrophosphatase MutT (NUDIX family)